ncbi:MAG: hypothetical protein KC912_23745 [Proteobacteria bacterium]|nr:hypothetical protein [Pseudomonadota bacterium]
MGYQRAFDRLDHAGKRWLVLDWDHEGGIQPPADDERVPSDAELGIECYRTTDFDGGVRQYLYRLDGAGELRRVELWDRGVLHGEDLGDLQQRRRLELPLDLPRRVTAHLHIREAVTDESSPETRTLVLRAGQLVQEHPGHVLSPWTEAVRDSFERRNTHMASLLAVVSLAVVAFLLAGVVGCCAAVGAAW